MSVRVRVRERSRVREAARVELGSVLELELRLGFGLWLGFGFRVRKRDSVAEDSILGAAAHLKLVIIPSENPEEEETDHQRSEDAPQQPASLLQPEKLHIARNEDRFDVAQL